MIELLVICMKEYSVSQSTFLAPSGRDSFSELYVEALRILVRALETSEKCYHMTKVSPAQMRRQFQLAGLLSLTMLLCEQVNRIAMRSSEPIAQDDSVYLELVLQFLG